MSILHFNLYKKTLNLRVFKILALSFGGPSGSPYFVNEGKVKMSGVLVVGSLNMDCVLDVSSIAKPGETIMGSKFRMTSGGKGANQAVASSKAGAKTRILGAVGTDGFGKELLDSLQDLGVDVTDIIIKSDVSTGLAMIQVDSRGENSIAVYSGANGELTAENIQNTYHAFQDSQVLLLQNEIPLSATLQSLIIAHSLKLHTYMNPSPIIDLPDQFYQLTDTMVLNRHEASFLSGNNIKNQQDAIQSAWRIIGRGCNEVLITLGENGAVFINGVSGEVVYQPAFQVKPIDTTGAGDTMVGSFAAYRLQHGNAQSALKFAAAASAISVQKSGAQQSMPDYNQTINFLGEVEGILP